MYTTIRTDPTQCKEGSTYCDGLKRMMCIDGYWVDGGFGKECMIIESPKSLLVEGLVGGYIAGQVGNEVDLVSTIVDNTPPQSLTPYLVVGALVAIVGGAVFATLGKRR